MVFDSGEYWFITFVQLLVYYLQLKYIPRDGALYVSKTGKCSGALMLLVNDTIMCSNVSFAELPM